MDRYIMEAQRQHVLRSTKYQCEFFENAMAVLLKPKPWWLPAWIWRRLVQMVVELQANYRIGVGRPD